jgi:hypothetical protein
MAWRWHFGSTYVDFSRTGDRTGRPSRQNKAEGNCALRPKQRLFGKNYCFFTGFLVVRFAGFLADSRPPIRLNASVELNGN